MSTFVRSTRSRFQEVCTYDLEDILADSCSFPDMKTKVDKFINSKYKKSGMVDGHMVAEDVFSDSERFDVFNYHHLAVIGYIIQKFCEVSHSDIKEFLRGMEAKYSNYGRFKNALRRMWIMPMIRKEDDSLHFRKIEGSFV